MKPPFQASRKPARKSHKPPQAHKKRIRKSKVAPTSSGDVKSKVERLKRIYDTGHNVTTYEAIAAKLSALAGLHNGHVWSWNYVKCIHSGAIKPGKKFVRVLDLCLAQINPRQKKWFYFARRRSVACVYDKSVLGEILLTHFKQIGYKPVTYTRYMQIKSRK